MERTQVKLRSHSSLGWCLLGIGFLSGCNRHIEIVSNTTVSGTVNASAFEGRITATLNTGGGGRSSCEYTQLPPGFTPGTIGTQG